MQLLSEDEEAPDKASYTSFTQLFTVVFTAKIYLWESQAPETSGKVWSKEDTTSLEEEQVSKHLHKLGAHRSMEPKEYTPNAEVAGQSHCRTDLDCLTKVMMVGGGI